MIEKSVFFLIFLFIIFFKTKNRSDGEQEGQVATTKSAMFPLKWSAPELLSQKLCSIFSDMWSFGVLAVEVFEKDKPFPELGGLEFAMALVEQRFIPSLPDSCPIVMRKELNKCFAFNPEDRPTATEMAVFLMNYANKR